MARRKLTKNQIEYNKQVRRIKNFIKRAEKRGYEFNEDILPKTPKRITKQAIKRLEGIKCGFRQTSCPDQLAKNLKQYKENKD